MATDKSIEIFVRLLKEGTEVWRPTQAQQQDDGTFKVLALPGYDLLDETWEFPPGSVVLVEAADDHLRAVKAP